MWRVTVLCEGFKNVARTKLMREKVKVLIEASSADEAMGVGTAMAERLMPMGPKWESFTAMEAVWVSLPVLVAKL